MAMRRLIISVMLLVITVSPVAAQTVPPEIDESLWFEIDDALALRASEIARQLRCPICQGQSIAESDAPIAKRLRILVVEQLQQGKSDDEVIADIVARYGDFVHFKPPVNRSTFLLWLGPLLVLGGMVFVAARRMAPGKK